MLRKGPPPGNIGKKDIAVGVAGLKAQMANPMFVAWRFQRSKGGDKGFRAWGMVKMPLCMRCL